MKFSLPAISAIPLSVRLFFTTRLTAKSMTGIKMTSITNHKVMMVIPMTYVTIFVYSRRILPYYNHIIIRNSLLSALTPPNYLVLSISNFVKSPNAYRTSILYVSPTLNASGMKLMSAWQKSTVFNDRI